jgi:7-cyano-7-deazaguanine synthase
MVETVEKFGDPQGPKAVVLSSGGLDSSTVMAIARDQGYRLFSLSFRYGQRHLVEIEAARRVSRAMGAEKHLEVNVDLAGIGGSALTDVIDVPKDRSREEMTGEIPVTYVPARNTVFLSLGLAWAEVLMAERIYIGVNALDYSGYPDCRPEFIEAFERLAQLATKAGVEGKLGITVAAPLIRLSKAQIIRKGLELGVDYSLTHSCYDPTPSGLHCGRCDSCLLRKKGFQEAGMKDPTRYSE